MSEKLTNRNWFDFHIKLLGFDFFRQGKFIPKYFLFYRGYDANILVLNEYHDIKAVKKI